MSESKSNSGLFSLISIDLVLLAAVLVFLVRVIATHTVGLSFEPLFIYGIDLFLIGLAFGVQAAHLDSFCKWGSYAILAFGVLLAILGCRSQWHMIKDCRYAAQLGSADHILTTTDSIGERFAYYDTDTNRFSRTLLPGKLRAKTAEDIAAVVLHSRSAERVIDYDTQYSGFRYIDTLQLLDLRSGELLLSATVPGEDPGPMTTKADGSGSDVYGNAPTEAQLREETLALLTSAGLIPDESAKQPAASEAAVAEPTTDPSLPDVPNREALKQQIEQIRVTEADADGSMSIKRLELILKRSCPDFDVALYYDENGRPYRSLQRLLLSLGYSVSVSTDRFRIT